MSEPIFNDVGLKALYLGLDGLAVRQHAIANNIANVDTPNYKAQRVQFETHLQRALRRDEAFKVALKVTHVGHLTGSSPSGTPAVTVDSRPNTLRNDGNNVDIDLEMTELAETAIRFQALSQITGLKLTRLKTLIRDSR